jgi:hypothetical protein
MSTRIKLHISQRPDRDDPLVVVTRLICRVSFYREGGELGPERYGILDTGAPVSLIPKRMWQDYPVLKLKDATVRGIIDRPECALEVIDGVIGAILTDGESMSEPLTIRAHLAHTDNVPLLLGFSGLLDRADVCFSVNTSEAYLEI